MAVIGLSILRNSSIGDVMAKHWFKVYVAYRAGKSVKQNIEREAQVAGLTTLIFNIWVPEAQSIPKRRSGLVHYAPDCISIEMEADRTVYDFVSRIDGVSKIADSLESNRK